VRDLANSFFLGLASSVPSVLERYGSAADNPELDALPEEVQVMLGDKDCLLNAIQVPRCGGFTQSRGTAAACTDAAGWC
jgi:hypothetical protein